MPFKLFQNGNILTAQEVQEYMMNQQIMVFASQAARDAAISTPTDGMFAFLKDTNKLTVYTDQWRNV
jgi:hypothetical protein